MKKCFIFFTILIFVSFSCSGAFASKNKIASRDKIVFEADENSSDFITVYTPPKN